MTPQMGEYTKQDADSDIATHAVKTTGVHGVGAGDIVGTTLAQTLTNKTLTSPTIQGTVSAGTGLTMPAFTMAGDISLGANKLKTTNLLLKEVDSTFLGVRNSADDGYRNFVTNQLNVYNKISMRVSGASIESYNVDNASVICKARDNGVGLVEIFRMVSATAAHLLLTRAKFTTSAHAADADHRGMLYL